MHEQVLGEPQRAGRSWQAYWYGSAPGSGGGPEVPKQYSSRAQVRSPQLTPAASLTSPHGPASSWTHPLQPRAFSRQIKM